jgi:hypothetical protein
MASGIMGFPEPGISVSNKIRYPSIRNNVSPSVDYSPAAT